VAARDPVLPVYIWDAESAPSRAQGAARWWLWRSLAALDADLRRRGSRLLLLSGPAVAALSELAARTRARSLHYSLTLEPGEPAPAELARRLAAAGTPLEVTAHPPNLVCGPAFPLTASGTPYRVFTPFWYACLVADPPLAPLPAPSKLTPPATWPQGLSLGDVGRAAVPPWTASLAEAWIPGEAAARDRLSAFRDRLLGGYAERRDRPDLDVTSRLSPHLHFGEISARTVWHAVHDAVQAQTGREATAQHANGALPPGAEAFLRQLGWREFAHQILYARPDTVEQPLRPDFRHFPWHDDEEALAAWVQGRTGYPLVDAGMRELWATGWMHNRVRLVCASFLTKHLLVPWQRGAEWFRQTLVDADLANNTFGWQWVSGCGADAAPYFRIFNPVAQGRRFDPSGAYVRRWLPELAALPDRWIHAPWSAPAGKLHAAGLRLAPPRDLDGGSRVEGLASPEGPAGVSLDSSGVLAGAASGPQAFSAGVYPEPFIDHGMARRRALDAYAAMREAGSATNRPYRSR